MGARRNADCGRCSRAGLGSLLNLRAALLGFPFAPLSAAVAAYLVLSVLTSRANAPRQAAETVLACALLGSAGYIVWNEGFSNWQALWFGGALSVLAIILLRARGAPG